MSKDKPKHPLTPPEDANMEEVFKRMNEIATRRGSRLLQLAQRLRRERTAWKDRRK